MVRARMGTRMAVVGTAFAALWLSAGPAQAGVGDLVDDTVDTAGAGAVSDTLRDVEDTVNDTVGDVEDTVDHTVGGTVGKVTDSTTTVVKDTVQKVTEPAKPSPQTASGGAGGEATVSSPPAPEPQQQTLRVENPKPQNARAADRSAVASSAAPPQRQKAHSGQPSRERASARESSRRTPARGDSLHRPLVVESRAGLLATAPALPADHPCASESLAVLDLLRCAHEGIPLPSLGGIPGILPPAGLLMLGLGLVMVARQRRRASVGSAI